MENEKNKKGNAIIKYCIFLFNPIFGFIVSLKDIKSQSSYNIFFLFTILFGMCFTVPSGRTADFTGDGAVYRLRFDRMAAKTDNDFEKVYKEYIQFEEGEKDFYVTAFSYIISRFTTNYHWAFTFFAFVFGFFMIKSLRFLTDDKQFNNSIYCFLLVIVFIMSNSIFNINGLRFWTASWIGVYCIFQIFLKNKRSYFLLAALTPFVHVSFFVYLLVITIAYFSRKNSNFWFCLFVISFFVSSFAEDLLKIAESVLPAFISRTISLYTDAEVVANMRQDTVWFAKVFSFLEKFVINVTLILFYRNRAEIAKHPLAYSLYLFLIVWMTFVNFSIAVPSLGGRFLRLALPLIVYIWMVLWKDQRTYFNWLIFFLFAFILDFSYQFRSILKVTEIEFYISSPFYSLYHYLF